MEIEGLSEKVRKAKEAVDILEEPLKTEAFKKILDKLLDEENQEKTKNRKNKIVKSNNPKSPNKENKRIKEEADIRKRNLAAKINRTEHTQIHDLSNALSKSLFVLQIMKDKGNDGLTPPELAYILKEVFREKVSQASISMALKDAHKYVDRDRIVVGHAIAYVYRIMKNGEDYLNELMKEKNNNQSGLKAETSETNLSSEDV